MRFSSSGDDLPLRGVSITGTLVVDLYAGSTLTFSLLALGVVGVGVVGVYIEAGSLRTSPSVTTAGKTDVILTLSVTASTSLEREARTRTVFKGVGGRGLVGAGPLLGRSTAFACSPAWSAALIDVDLLPETRTAGKQPSSCWAVETV